MSDKWGERRGVETAVGGGANAEVGRAEAGVSKLGIKAHRG